MMEADSATVIAMRSTTLATALLLACSTAVADRPAMSERSAMPEPVMQSPAETVVPAPVMEPEPAVRTEVQQSGDVLEIQPGETVPVKMLDFPRRGMSMSRVQNELGEPLMISPTVGQPPITTWSYPDRKVYFEGDLVIHTVSIN